MNAAGETITFNQHIRPILSDKCFTCHGPDIGTRKAGLRLDIEEGALGALRKDPGRHVIVPGKPAESALIERITNADPDEVMPPPDIKKEVTDDEIDLIRRWIEAGAPWQTHWAYVTPRSPILPDVIRTDWPRQPIDRFILSRLEQEGLSPSPEADRRTLIRRVALDLCGLPPSRAEVEAFVGDDQPGAYERMVDRLLASGHYGEHMAHYWLDAARYGDTHGLHLDNYRSMWPYRDWVIKAFNDNMPFDQFTIEQLAGDLLPEPTLDQRVATGFNRCNVTTSEGGAIKEEFFVRYAVDRASTTATVWMGLTAGCAVCHDHKYDPLSQKEFYRLYAYFNNVAEPAMDGNKSSVPPVVNVPGYGREKVLAEIEAKLGAWSESLAAREPDPEAFKAWASTYRLGEDRRKGLEEGLVARFTFDEEGGNKIISSVGEAQGQVGGGALRLPGVDGQALYFLRERQADIGKLGAFEKDQAFSYGAWIFLNKHHTGTVLSKMDDNDSFRGYDLYLAEGVPMVHIIHKWSENGLRVDAAEPLPLHRWVHLFAVYDGSGKAGGVTLYLDGEPLKTTAAQDSLTETIKTEKAFRIGRRNPSAALETTALDDLRLYARALTADEVRGLVKSPVDRMLAVEESRRSDEDRRALHLAFLSSSAGEAGDQAGEGTRLRSLRLDEGEHMVTTLVMQENQPRRKAYVLERGEYDKPAEEVQPGVPAMLPPLPEDAPANRLGLARWLVSREHPLTARVTINRIWQQLFGTGIVQTTENFGLQSSFPTHPELLDWLAVDFMEHDWDLKRVLRNLVSSATYRQSARTTEEHLRRDPDNLLLARGPRFRLEAEAVRDQALTLSGLLVDTIGGPSVKPYQPPGLWQVVAYPKSDTATFKQDQGESLYRRSLYSFWKRTSPPPTMTLLDAPSRESCTVRRGRTNTPLQALALMNDTQFVEAARAFGTRALREGGSTPEAQLCFLFTSATARPPEPAEAGILARTLNTFRDHYRERPDDARALIATGDSTPPDDLDPADLAAWTMVASQVLNLDEVLNKN